MVTVGILVRKKNSSNMAEITKKAVVRTVEEIMVR